MQRLGGSAHDLFQMRACSEDLGVRRRRRPFAALEFKCDVLWAMLDALYHAYVAPGHVPPGAFVPEDAKNTDTAK